MKEKIFLFVVILLGIGIFAGSMVYMNSQYEYLAEEEWNILETAVETAFSSEDKLIELPSNVNLDMSDAPEKISANYYNSYELVEAKLVNGQLQTKRYINSVSMNGDFCAFSLIILLLYVLAVIVFVFIYNHIIVNIWWDIKFRRNYKKKQKALSEKQK